MPDPFYAIFVAVMLGGYSLVFVALYVVWNRKLRRLKESHEQRLSETSPSAPPSDPT